MSHKKNTQSKAQQKTYYELLSLMLLKRKFPDIYSDLEYVGGNHTPDLETPNHSIGVEVTCAFKKEHMERQAFLMNMLEKNTQLSQLKYTNAFTNAVKFLEIITKQPAC